VLRGIKARRAGKGGKALEHKGTKVGRDRRTQSGDKAGKVGRGPEHKEAKGDRVGKAGRTHRVAKGFKASKAGRDYRGFKPPQDNSTDAIFMTVLPLGSTRDLATI
jgi:hypothetical protein